jgi:hypothetical protein
MKWLTVLLISGIVMPAFAQRDPTLPPSVTHSDGGASPTDTPLGKGGIAVVVRDGVPYLVDGTRLYRVGQTLGSSRIERISETEVWLRNGKTLRKLQRFSGIERKPAAKDKGSNP